MATRKGIHPASGLSYKIRNDSVRMIYMTIEHPISLLIIEYLRVINILADGKWTCHPYLIV